MSNIIAEKNEARKKVIGRLILIFLLIMIALTFFSNTILNFTLPRVKTEQPSSGAIVREISAEGVVEIKELLYVYAGAGRLVDDIFFKEGDRVEKDQVIGILDREELEEELKEENIRYEKLRLEMEKLTGEGAEISLKKMERDIEQAQRKIEEAEENLKLAEALFEAGIEPKESLKRAEESLKVAKSDYDAAIDNLKAEKISNEIRIKQLQYDIKLQENRLKKIRRELEEGTEIKSPCSGIIKELGFRKGTYTTSNTPFFTVADLEKGFQLRAPLDKEKSKYLSVGDEVDVNIKSLEGKRIVGKIREITQSSQQSFNMVDLLIDIPQEELSGGEPADISISKRTKFYNILVPNSAIHEDDRGKFVYLLKEIKGPLGNEYYVQKASVIVEDSDSFRSAVTIGLSRDDRIIVSSDKFISDQSRVLPAR